MDKIDLDIFGLRFRFKRSSDADSYLFVEKIGTPRQGGWYLTIPLSPLRKGPDQGYHRPHLSRRRGRRKERKALDATSLMPFPVAGVDWPGALKVTAEDAMRFLQRMEPMQKELLELHHYEEYEYDDATMRRLVVAVYVHDPVVADRFHQRILEQVEREGRLVIDESALDEPDPELQAFWRSADHLDTLAPGTREEPIRVRLRGGCGHEFETSVYRRDDGTWVERRFCCSGDTDRRREIIDRYIGAELREAFPKIIELLGLVDDANSL